MAEVGKKADPFEGCVIPRCHGKTMPTELFCDGHDKLVPSRIKERLWVELRKQESDLAVWHALVREAASAVGAQLPATK
jgi:hypothetical protein